MEKEKIHIELSADQIKIISPLWRDLRKKGGRAEAAALVATRRHAIATEAKRLFWTTAEEMFPALKEGHSHYDDKQKVFENGGCDCASNPMGMLLRELRYRIEERENGQEN